ncbi:MAG: hypothetical protein KGI41_03970 [Patescibacteria group bacterium]|nr:hypothetical protein [Patescibacteria group bacterium]MDE1966367.1 hypothetical protein [Patescibacteria group bacterium]
MKGDALFFAGILIFIFIVWVATGGPSRPISFAGPFLTPLTPTGQTHGYYLSSGRGEGGGAPTTGSISAQVSQTQSQVNQLEQQVTAYQAFGNPSPYRGLVTLSRGSFSGVSAASQEYLQMQLSSQATTSVSITGWTVESTVTGKSALIPGGTMVPLSGVINASGTITLDPGDTAFLISGQSPIGASFRTNLCIGYFAQFQKFYPQLPSVCPMPVDEANRVLSDLNSDDACRAFLNSVPRCTLVSNKPVNLTTDCTNFIENDLNYNGCVMLHRNEAAFNGSRWYVYLGRTTPMWKSQYETVKLLDANGLTVAMFSY